MKNLVRNIGNLFNKNRKVSILVCSLVGVLAVGGVSFGIVNGAKQAAMSKALLAAAETGIISAEDAQNIPLNQEIVDPTTGETIVAAMDENGNIVTTVVKDASGAAVPGGEYTPSAPTGHTHTWLAHYATRPVTTQVEHPAVTHTERVCVHEAGIYCNICGFYAGESTADVDHEHGGWHTDPAKYEFRTVVDSPAWVETVTTQEQYVDYYYCSECGARQ